MNAPNHPPSQPSLGSDVDDTAEHWNSLLEELGAQKPENDWDVQAAETAQPSGEAHAPPEKTKVAPPAPRDVDAGTDWMSIAGQLGVRVTAEPENEPDVVGSVAEASLPWERSAQPGDPSSETSEANETTRVAPESPVGQSLWPDEDLPPSKADQAELDRMFGADSLRPLDPTEDARPRYFDLADEDEYPSDEVHFARQDEPREKPREEPPVEPSPAGEGDAGPDREGRRRGGRSRRSKSRRRDRGHAARETHVAPEVGDVEADSRLTEPSSFESDEELFGPGILDDAEELDRSEPGLELDDDDDYEEAPAPPAGRKSKQRKAADWKEAVGYIISRNMEQRERESPSGSRRRGGGRRRR